MTWHSWVEDAAVYLCLLAAISVYAAAIGRSASQSPGRSLRIARRFRWIAWAVATCAVSIGVAHQAGWLSRPISLVLMGSVLVPSAIGMVALRRLVGS